MKFGTTYEELQKNPLFQKYLPNCKFLDYNKLKKDIKYIKQNIQCSEENKLQFITTLELFLKQTESFILSILNERKQQPEQIKHINTYRSLQEYSQINKEAVRKISKKYDKILEIAPFLQQQMLDKMASMEIGSRSIIQAQILKAELEEQELFEKENFTLLKQDVILLRECSEDVKLMDKDQFEIKNKTAKTNAQIQLYQNSQNMASDYPINLRTDSELKQEDKIKPLEIEQEQVKSTEELTWKQWLKKNKQLIELSSCYIVIMFLPVFLAQFVNEDTSDIKTVLIFALPLSFFLGASLGGNDICNSVGTTYGSKTLSMKQCILLGIFFEVLGALTLGGRVSKTISKNIIDPTAYYDDPTIYAIAMTSVLAGAAFCVCSVTVYGIPVSITKAVIFGLTSAGLASMGGDGISMNGLLKVIISLITSPLVGGLISMSLFLFIIYVVKKKKNPYASALNWLPFLGFFNVSTLTYITLFKGVKMEPVLAAIIAIISASIIAVLLFVFTTYKKKQNKGKQMTEDEQNEFSKSLFKPLLIISASAGAFAHGANNVGNSVGPLVGVLGVYNDGVKSLESDFDTPTWVLILGACSFAAGILLVGSRTIKTMGKGITQLDPMKSFAIEIGSASAILIASLLGIPVSTSHVSVGCVIGGTIAEKIAGYPYVIKKKALKKMVSSWFYTIPFVYVFVIYFYYSFKGVFY